jgi:hypothetical protein
MSDGWENAVNLMIDSINTDNNMRDYFIRFEPDPNTGYAWYQDPQYKYYTGILSTLTDSSGHSGASFACCLREAVNRIRSEQVVVKAESVTETKGDHIITLEPTT